MQPPGSHWGTEMKSGLGAVFFTSRWAKTQGGSTSRGDRGLATFSHTQNPITEIYWDTLQPKYFPA